MKAAPCCRSSSSPLTLSWSTSIRARLEHKPCGGTNLRRGGEARKLTPMRRIQGGLTWFSNAYVTAIPTAPVPTTATFALCTLGPCSCKAVVIRVSPADAAIVLASLRVEPNRHSSSVRNCARPRGKMCTGVVSVCYAHEAELSAKKQKRKGVRPPGIEPGVPRWQRDMLPLHHGRMRGCRKMLSYSYCLSVQEMLKPCQHSHRHTHHLLHRHTTQQNTTYPMQLSLSQPLSMRLASCLYGQTLHALPPTTQEL